MQVAHIYSIKNQDLYRDESVVMILAHLAKKHLYKPVNFKSTSHIIMDNGLYEKSQVSTSVDDLVDIAESLGFHVDEIIVPDVLNECEQNIKMFEQNLDQIKKHNDKYQFMFVAQAKTIEELDRAIDYINQYAGQLNLVVGISKLCPFNRADVAAIDVYRKCKFPIHFLGIKTTFAELGFTKNTFLKDLIRSCDTSQSQYIAKNETELPLDVVNYVRSGRAADGRGVEGVDVDLETDYTDPQKIKAVKHRFESQFYITTLMEYIQFVREGASPKYDNKLALLGLVGEVGELADVIKKQTIYDDMSQFESKYGMSVKDKIVDEAGDVLWQFINLLNVYNITFDEIINQNYCKLIKRHLGVKTSKNGGGMR